MQALLQGIEVQPVGADDDDDQRSADLKPGRSGPSQPVENLLPRRRRDLPPGFLGQQAILGLARISGETDFPCIFGDRVGLGRSYVKLDRLPPFDRWGDALAPLAVQYADYTLWQQAARSPLLPALEARLSAAEVTAGARVRWTDLRMALGGYEERKVGQGIVLSNWEI